MFKNLFDGEMYESFLADMLGFLGNFALTILILLVGWILARTLSSLIAKLLTRLGVDKLADKINNIETLHNAKIKVDPIKILKKFVYWAIMLFVILIAVDNLGLTIVSEQIGLLIAFLPKLLSALVIFAIGFYISDAIKGLVASACKSFGVKSWKVISTVVFFFLLISVAVTALNQAEINTDIITTNVSLIIGGVMLAFAVAYGLAARNVLASMLATFYNKDKYQVGQVLEVDGHKGRIIKMDAISFTLESGEEQIVFPLNRLINDKVVIYPNEGN